MRKLAVILGLVFVVVFAFQALADGSIHMRSVRSAQYLVSYWTTEQGLPQNTITCLLQSRDGYLWAGTRYGLARFDGVRFKAFTDELIPLGDGSLDVRGLVQDREGRLWLNLRTGLACFEHGRFERVTLDGTPFSGGVQDFCASPGGGLWVAQAKGLFHLENARMGQSFGVEKLAGDYGGDSKEIERVFPDPQGRLWVLLTYAAGSSPLWLRVSPRTDAVETLASVTGLKLPDVGGLVEDLNGRLWLARPGELLCVEDGKVSRFNATAAWGNHPVKRLTLNAQGHVWVISGGPVQLHRFRDGEFASYGRTEGFTNPDDVRCALPDREGNLWVGTGMGGLHRLQPRQLVTMLSGSYSTMDEVYSVSPGGEGRVWLATTYGLVRFRDGEFTVFTNTAAQQPGGWMLRTRTAIEDQAGNVWCGLDSGLWQLRREAFTGVETPLLHGRQRVASLLEARHGALWAGTSCGLLECLQGQFRLWTTNEGLTDSAIFGLVQAADGSLWAGTERGGVNSLREGRWRAFTVAEGLLSSNAWPLCAEADGTVWVGTPRGLNRIRGDEVRSVTTRQGLYDNLAYCLLEDRQGRYWSFCNRGIWRTSKTNLHAVADGAANWVACVAYGEADGMISSEGNGDQQPNAAVMPNGELWFPTTRGVVILDPAQLRDNLVPPGVVIEEVRVDEETVFKDGGVAKPEIRNPSSETRPKSGIRSQQTTALDNAEARTPLRLAPGRARVLEIHYTANTFMDSEKARFRFRLEGHDAAWHESTPRRVALYTNLRPGAYRFLVKACNHHGYWSEGAAEFRFTLTPHYYQTWWFRILCVLALVSVMMTWHFRRLERRRQRHQDQEQRLVAEERSRIARDLHDDLGANLTGLALKIEAARHLKEPRALHDQLKETAASLRAAVGRLREAIWSINPECDTLESFCAHLGQYADTLLTNAGLRCRLDLPVEIPARVLPANVRHHLFLVAKEALHNVTRHARATEVQVAVRLEGGSLVLAVADNGRGLGESRETVLPKVQSHQDATTQVAGSSGYGLTNMRQRVESLGGEFRLTSTCETGTRITVRILLAGSA